MVPIGRRFAYFEFSSRTGICLSCSRALAPRRERHSSMMTPRSLSISRRLERDVLRPVFEDEQRAVEHLGVVRRYLQHVHGFVETRERVHAGAEAHADRFHERHDLELRKVLRAVERHVLDEMRKSALVVIFQHGAGVYDQPQFCAVLRSPVAADVVAKAVLELAGADLRIDGHSTAERRGIRRDGRLLRTEQGGCDGGAHGDDPGVKSTSKHHAHVLVKPGSRRTNRKIAIIRGPAGAVKRRPDDSTTIALVASLVRYVVVILLGLEALNAVLWAGRIVTYFAAYDAAVLVMVLFRAAVTTLQIAAVWMLAGRALAAVLFARWALALSAGLLIFEIGLRMSPSSVPPGLRIPAVVAYAVYAMAAILALGVVRRPEEEV